MIPDSTLAVTNTCPKDGVHLSGPQLGVLLTRMPPSSGCRTTSSTRGSPRLGDDRRYNPLQETAGRTRACRSPSTRFAAAVLVLREPDRHARREDRTIPRAQSATALNTNHVARNAKHSSVKLWNLYSNSAVRKDKPKHGASLARLFRTPTSRVIVNMKLPFQCSHHPVNVGRHTVYARLRSRDGWITPPRR